MTAKEVSLKVAEAIQDDVNKGIVRIDFLTLPALQSILAESEVIYGPIPISE